MHTKSIPISAAQALLVLMELEEQICDLAREALAASLVVDALDEEIKLCAEFNSSARTVAESTADWRDLANVYSNRIEEMAIELRKSFYQAFRDVAARTQAEQQNPGKPSRKPTAANDVQPRGVLQ